MCPTGFKSEGEINPLIAQPCAPAHESGDGGLGSLFALNPDDMDRGAQTACPKVADKVTYPAWQ